MDEAAPSEPSTVATERSKYTTDHQGRERVRMQAREREGAGARKEGLKELREMLYSGRGPGILVKLGV
jgi:hypothetical protein